MIHVGNRISGIAWFQCFCGRTLEKGGCSVIHGVKRGVIVLLYTAGFLRHCRTNTLCVVFGFIYLTVEVPTDSVRRQRYLYVPGND